MLNETIVQGNKLQLVFGRSGVFINVTFSQLETRKIKKILGDTQWYAQIVNQQM